MLRQARSDVALSTVSRAARAKSPKMQLDDSIDGQAAKADPGKHSQQDLGRPNSARLSLMGLEKLGQQELGLLGAKKTMLSQLSDPEWTTPLGSHRVLWPSKHGPRSSVSVNVPVLPSSARNSS